jgi:hypothetical protein
MYFKGRASESVEKRSDRNTRGIPHLSLTKQSNETKNTNVNHSELVGNKEHPQQMANDYSTLITKEQQHSKPKKI